MVSGLTGARRVVVKIGSALLVDQATGDLRDAWLDGVEPRPASTLMIVGGFTRPEFVVEVEATAWISA